MLVYVVELDTNHKSRDLVGVYTTGCRALAAIASYCEQNTGTRGVKWSMSDFLVTEVVLDAPHEQGDKLC